MLIVHTLYVAFNGTYSNTISPEKKIILLNAVNSNVYGNTIGNLGNVGFVAPQGDWVYFYSTSSTNNKTYLMKIKKMGHNLNRFCKVT